MKARLVRPQYFIWTVVPVALWLIWFAFGLPHVLWAYDWRGADNASYEHRWKTVCYFVGPYGRKIAPARNGSCGWWVRFFKQNEGAS